jgi:hypothetical protein
MRLNKYGFVGISHVDTNGICISGLDAFLRSDLKSFMGHIGTPDFSSLVDYVSMVNMIHHGDIVD